MAALLEDLVGEILLRIPPPDPAHLVRASLVCKRWRRLLADPAFLRRYRAFHRTPLLLGYFNFGFGLIRRFIPGTPCSPFSPPALDCRHGRALLHAFYLYDEFDDLVLWDPITGDQQHLPLPAYSRYSNCLGAVLCAAPGCDHLYCRGGPFLVVLVGTEDPDNKLDVDGTYTTWATEYSSETGTWSPRTSIDIDSFVLRNSGGLLTGGAVYFTIISPNLRTSILKYDLGARSLSVMDAPEGIEKEGMVTSAEDAGLGFASEAHFKLFLWSWQTRADGIAGWVQRRIIELDELLQIPRFSTEIVLVGFLDTTDTIFISTDAGLFVIEPKSRKVRKVGEVEPYYCIVPCLSFYTPELAEAILPPL